MHSLWRMGALTLALVLLAGCTRVNSGVVGMFELDTDVHVEFEIAKDINPDENHTPSPLFVRLYELKDDAAFKKADFIGLYEQDESLLGKDLIGKQELNRLVPGESRKDKFVVDPGTRFVALFAEFYQFKNAKYKLIFPVTSNNVIENSVKVLISDNQMLLRGK